MTVSTAVPVRSAEDADAVARRRPARARPDDGQRAARRRRRRAGRCWQTTERRPQARGSRSGRGRRSGPPAVRRRSCAAQSAQTLRPRHSTVVADLGRQHPHVRRELRGVLGERRRRLDAARPGRRGPSRAASTCPSGSAPRRAAGCGAAPRRRASGSRCRPRPRVGPQPQTGSEREVDRPPRSAIPSNRSVSPAK